MDTIATDTDKILAQKEGAVGWLLYNNPDRRNAVSIEMSRAAEAVVKAFEADDEVRVIALRGTGGKSFVSGADISEFEKNRSDSKSAARYESSGVGMYTTVRQAEKPTVAVIDGFCMGGGVALACACDIRICTDDSIFAIPAARLSIGYRPDFVNWVMQAVGPAATKEILITGRRYSAGEALRMGLAQQVVPRDEFDAFANDYLASIASNAPLSMKAAKLVVHEIAKGWGEVDEELCRQLIADCADSEDFKEGRTAFMEKRTPEFKGR